MSRWLLRATGEDVAELGGFSVLYSDNPWRYRVQGGRGAADKQYQTMSTSELCLMPVEKLAAPDSVLFMWGVWPMLFDAGAVMKAWGFEYLNCGFIWVKTNKIEISTPFFGQGHYTRGNSEFCLMGRRGKPKRVNAAVAQIVQDDTVYAPIGEHSEKPAVVRQRIEQLMGTDQPAVELFARESIPGWESFWRPGHTAVHRRAGALNEKDRPEASPRRSPQRSARDVSAASATPPGS